MGKIDLHIHTNKSDGELSPIEVIDEAKRKNVDESWAKTIYYRASSKLKEELKSD